jgi:hypothetical protein
VKAIMKVFGSIKSGECLDHLIVSEALKKDPC